MRKKFTVFHTRCITFAQRGR